MTEVAFHFNAPDRLGYACRLLRKAFLTGAYVQVLADKALVTALDQALWTLTGTAFVPHCTEAAPASIKGRSPILISEPHHEPHDSATVLVNLSDQMPQAYQGFSRVIEIVTADPQVRSLARERWKHYKAGGLEPRHLDLLQSPAER